MIRMGNAGNMRTNSHEALNSNERLMFWSHSALCRDVVSLGFEIRVQEGCGDEGISDDVRSRVFHRVQLG